MAAATPYADPNAPAGNPISIGGSGINTPGYVPIGGPAITQLTNLGLNPGLSPWAELATSQQAQLAENAENQGAQSVAGQTTQTDANIAANGGLSSGARERAAEGGQKDYLAMVQGAQQGQNTNDQQIAMNDAQNKLQQLGTAGNLEAQNTSQENAYNANLYQQQMAAWGAQQQAEATANAGKK